MIEQKIFVDCIITDPPYGKNHYTNRRKIKGTIITEKGIKNDGDNYELLNESLKLSYQLLKENRHFKGGEIMLEIRRMIYDLRDVTQLINEVDMYISEMESNYQGLEEKNELLRERVDELVEEIIELKAKNPVDIEE